MPFSYFPERLSTDPISAVRFHCHDTTAAAYHLHDEEIAYLLEEEADNVYLAAARACETISTQFAGQKGKSIGDLSIFSGSDQSANYLKMARQLRARALRSAPAVLINTAQSTADKQADRDDLALTQPFFARRQHDNPEGVSSHWASDLDDLEN